MTIKKTDLPELIVIILFSLYLFLLIIRSSLLGDLFNIDIVLKGYKFIVLVGLTLNLLNIKILKLNRLLLLVLLTGIVFIVAFISDRKTELLIPFLLILNGCFFHNSRYIKSYIYVTTITVSIISILAILGIIENDALIENRGIRYFLGFNYTTFVPNFFLHIYIAYISIMKKPITILETVLVLTINQLLFILTDTKAVYLIVLMTVLGLWIMRITSSLPKSKMFKIFSKYSMPVLALIMIFLASSYRDSFYFSQLDKVLSGRIRLGNKGIIEYGFSLFGNHTLWETGRQGIERSGDYFYVDSSFLQILLTYGIIILLLVILGFMYISIQAFNEKNYYLCVAIMLLALHGFTDPQLFDIRYNPLLLMFGSIILGNIRPIINPDNW